MLAGVARDVEVDNCGKLAGFFVMPCTPVFTTPDGKAVSMVQTRHYHEGDYTYEIDTTYYVGDPHCTPNKSDVYGNRRLLPPPPGAPGLPVPLFCRAGIVIICPAWLLLVRQATCFPFTALQGYHRLLSCICWLQIARRANFPTSDRVLHHAAATTRRGCTALSTFTAPTPSFQGPRERP